MKQHIPVKKSSQKNRTTRRNLHKQTTTHKKETPSRTKDKKTPEGKNNKSSTSHNFLKLGSRFFLTVAVFAFIIFFNLFLIRTFPVAKKETLGAADAKHIQPSEIIIKDLGIDLPVYPASFKNGSFDTTTQGASYLISSPLPGGTGNSVIYAHNWSNLFGNLYNVHTGEKVEIIFSDKSHKTFTVASTQTVHANQVSILNVTNDKRLTLFTCANFLDADRFVVTAIAY